MSSVFKSPLAFLLTALSFLPLLLAAAASGTFTGTPGCDTCMTGPGWSPPEAAASPSFDGGTALSNVYRAVSHPAPHGSFKKGSSETQLRFTLTQNAGSSDEIILSLKPCFSPAFFDSEDALKMFNPGLNLWSMSSDLVDLAINGLPLTDNLTDTVYLGVSAKDGGIYHLLISGIETLPKDVTVLLVDRYRGKTADLTSLTDWPMVINTDTGSYGRHRLMLIFLSNTPCITATSAIANKQVSLSWTSSTEVHTASYVVQHSSDGEQFSTVFTFQVTDTILLTPVTHAFVHATPDTGTNFYRIVRMGTNAEETMSNTVSVDLPAAVPTGNSTAQALPFVMYPVPARDLVTIATGETGLVHLEVYDHTGHLLKRLSAPGPELRLSLMDVAPGCYVVLLYAHGQTRMRMLTVR